MKISQLMAIIIPCCLATHAFGSTNYKFKINGKLSPEAVENIKMRLSEYSATARQQQKQDQSISILSRKFELRVAAKEAIEPFGYFNSKFKIKTEHKAKSTTFTAIITPGNPVIINSTKIKILGEGSSDPSFTAAIKNSALTKGQILHTEKFKELNKLLATISMNKGYFDAQYKKKEIRINRKKNTAKIIIIYDTGKRYKFGDTIIKADYFNKKFLKKYFRYEKGQKYDNLKLQQAQQALINSGYFSQAIITPNLPQKHNGEVPITVTLITGSKRKYEIGVGYSTDVGFNTTSKITDNYISRNGHTVYSSIQLSEPSKNLTIGYTIPGAIPDREQYKITAGYTRIEQTTGSSNGKKLSAMFVYNKYRLKQYLSINALQENYDLSSLNIKANSSLIYLTAGTSFSKEDNSLNPTNGYKIKAEFSGTINSLSNQSGFSQIIIGSNFIHTINKTNTRILARAELGETNINNLSNLPLSLQLYVGGVDSIRGYSYNQIGPGKHSYIASIEIQQKIFNNIYAAIYYDQGNATVNSDLFNNKYVGKGIGIGYLSIIGMIKINYTHAISLKNQPYVLQLSMGSQL